MASLKLCILLTLLLPSEGVPTSATESSAGPHLRHQRRREREGEEVVFPLRENFYTMYQDQAHATLKIRVDGRIEWDRGTPTLYSVFREQVIQERSSGELMYTLEASATRYWICMTGKGRLYTIPQGKVGKGGKGPHLNQIRDEEKKMRRRRRGGRHPPAGGRRRGGGLSRGAPPPDCLFKTFEFNPEESYERSVGIYSVAHSNATHGRFLSLSEESGQPRTFRKAFRTLYQHAQVKISQVPILTLRNMVNVTKFRSRRVDFNERVRKCIIHLLADCPNQQHRLRLDHTHFHRVIERCKRRAVRTSTTPKCASRRRLKRNEEQSRGGERGQRQQLSPNAPT